jgi:diguanylate cyclase (GGDEF)-like protein
MSRYGRPAQNLRMLPVSKELRNGYRDLVQESERTWAKLGSALHSAAVVSLNGAPVEADDGVVAGLLEGAAPNETVNVVRALLGRFAEIPSLAATAATLSRRLDIGVPDGGWDPFLRSIADAVSLELTVQAETARLRREVVTSPALGHLKTKMQMRLDNITRELLEFRHNDARRQDEHDRRASELSKEIAELKSRTDELIKLCAEQEARLMIDALTGCHSRYAYERRLEEEFQRWQRHSQPLTFSVWDIDLFKRVNDSYGHDAGDRLLRAVAQLFAQNKRAEDFLARIGGEEFALLLPMTTLEAATTVAEKLRCVIEVAAFRHHGEPVQVTVSAGLTDFRLGDTLTTVYERADGALYQAKQHGRNHCVVR